MTAAAFIWRNNLFLYYECMHREVSPNEIAGAAVPKEDLKNSIKA